VITFPRRTAVVLGIAVVLTACQSTASPGASPAASPAAESPASTSGESPPAEPTVDPSSFTCDLPIVGQPTVAIANIVDIRVGEHEGYDRLVFEFEQGIPEFTLARSEPPFTRDGSGDPMQVDGASFLTLVMRGGTKQTDEGTSSYQGPTAFHAAFDALVHAAEGGDFERQSTWHLGLSHEACVHAFTLDDPPRLGIDIEHP
jgi:hypothetical protein